MEETLKMRVKNCDFRAVLQSCNDLNLHNCNFGNFYIYNCMWRVHVWIWIFGFCWSMWYAAYKWLYTASTMSNVCSYQQQHRLSKHISFTLIETNLKSIIWNFRWLRYAATMSNVCAYQQEEFLRPQPDTLSDLTPKPWAHQHVHINMNTHQNIAIKTVTPPTNTQL